MYNSDYIKLITKQRNVIGMLEHELDSINRVNTIVSVAHESLGEMLGELSSYKEKFGANKKYSESICRTKNITLALSEMVMMQGKCEWLTYKVQQLSLENSRLKKVVTKLDEELTREETLSQLI